MKTRSLVLAALVLSLPLLACRLDSAAVEQQHVRTRVPAPVMSFHGADWLERPEREAEERPERVLDVMGLRPGDEVAEVGAGTGYFARRMARRVAPDGRVYAVDIQREMLHLLEERIAAERITNVIPVLGTPSDPRLPDGSLKWILLVDVYHEFQEPELMLDAMKRALAPGGRIALVEYRLEGESAAHIRTEHRMSTEQVRSEWGAAGFDIVAIDQSLPSQHLFVLEPRRRKEGQ